VPQLLRRRHKIKEVESWFVEEGLDPLLHWRSFDTASSMPVRPATDKDAHKRVVGAVSETLFRLRQHRGSEGAA
jgi:hypothetical protein